MTSNDAEALELSGTEKPDDQEDTSKTGQADSLRIQIL